MSTTIHPELSKKNEYWIEKHRYYELKHFCLQYPIWKEAYQSLDGLEARHVNLDIFKDKGKVSNPTERVALAKNHYKDRMDLVKKAAMESDFSISDYILKAVTEGRTYDYLKSRLDIPCSRGYYYNCYRKFFWILNKLRD